MSDELCVACQKPFDEVHPLDWVNDMLICREMNRNHPERCQANHTWREHVAKSFDYKWVNPHVLAERRERVTP